MFYFMDFPENGCTIRLNSREWSLVNKYVTNNWKIDKETIISLAISIIPHPINHHEGKLSNMLIYLINI